MSLPKGGPQGGNARLRPKKRRKRCFSGRDEWRRGAKGLPCDDPWPRGGLRHTRTDTGLKVWTQTRLHVRGGMALGMAGGMAFTCSHMASCTAPEARLGLLGPSAAGSIVLGTLESLKCKVAHRKKCGC